MARLTAKLGRVDALAIGIGSVIGVGIFRTSGEVLRGTGGIAGSTFVWLGVGLLSLLGATVYADMAIRIPEAGGPYAFVREAFGRYAAFIDGWSTAALTVPARQAVSVAVIGELLSGAIGLGAARTWAVAALLVLYALNVSGVRAGANAQRVFTTLKLVTVVAALALAARAHGRPVPDEAMPEAATLDVAVAGAWYAYLGWQDATHLAEEIERPRDTLRPVLVTIVVCVIACYVGVSLSVIAGLGDGAAARGPMPVRTLADVALGPIARGAMTIAILSSMVGGTAEGIMVRPRLWFALGRDGLAPRPLEQVGKSGAPQVAMTVHVAIVIVFLLTGSFVALLRLLTLSQALAATLEAASAIVLRRRDGERFPARAVIYALANLGAAALVAVHEPTQLAFTGLFVAALSALYFAFSGARRRR